MLEQVSAIVSSPIEDVRAWQPIVTRLRCDGYVVAPLVVDSKTVGTIHADCHFSQTTLDEGHRDLIASLAASLSHELSNRVHSDPLTGRTNLTPREDDVLTQLRHGSTNSQIA